MTPAERGKCGIAAVRCWASWFPLIGLLWLIVPAAVLQSQAAAVNDHGNLGGHVTDSTGAPVVDAIISLTGAAHAQWSMSTNSSGRFVFSNLPVGTYVVLVRKLGYRADYSTVTVTAGTGATIEVVLHMAPTQLSEVVIDAPIVLSNSGFEHRRQTGAGYYITADDIDTHHIFDFAGVLNLSPVLRVSRERGVQAVVTSTKPTMGGGYGCASVLIDRRPLGPLVPFPEPRDIAGMETYRPYGGPAEFGGGGCALVLVWTKDYRGR